MIGFLTGEAVVFLAHKRLVHLRDVLGARIADGVGVRAIDRQLHHLARKAVEYFETQPHVDVPLEETTFAPWLVDDVSRFALLGGLGVDLTRYAALHARGQSWLVDLLHGGTPDPDRARVRAGSTDLPLAVWRRASATMTAPADQARLRAWLLGHLCHVAAQVVIEPLLNDAVWQPGTLAAPKLTPQTATLILERAVSDRVFGRPDFAGKDWSGWLPPPEQIPTAFYEAFAAAIDEVAGAPRRKGSRVFEERLAAQGPPSLSATLLEDGYRNWHAIIARRYGWEYTDWLAATALLYVPTFAAVFFTPLLPHGRALFGTAPPGFDRERAWYEIIGLPLAVNALLPLGYFLYTGLGTHLGVGRETALALVSSIVSVAAAVGWFITALGDSGDAGLRWTLFIAAPVLFEVINAAYVLTRGHSEQQHALLATASLVHLGVVGLFLFVYWAWLQPVAESDLAADESWWRILLWLLLLAGLWALTAWFLKLGGDGRRRRLTELSGWMGGQAGTLGAPRYVRVFDDGTLHADPTAAAAPLAERHYPTGHRPLLRIWWTPGKGDLFVRSRRDHLEFSFTGNADATLQRVLAPLEAMTLADYATWLARAIRDPGPPGVFGDYNGSLHVARHPDVDWDHVLPPGNLFAAGGDTEATAAAAAAADLVFHPIPTAEADALVLHHAPRLPLSVRFGRDGAVVDEPRDTALAGPGTIAAVGAPTVAPDQIQGSPNTRFWTLFRPGDVIRTTGLAPNQSRVVVRVVSDRVLQVSLPFTAAAVGAAYERAPVDRDADLAGGVRVRLGADDFTLIDATLPAPGPGEFERIFMPGDTIRLIGAGGAIEERRVTAVDSPTQLRVHRPLLTALTRNVVVNPGPVLALGAPATQPTAAYVRVGRRQRDAFAATPPSPTGLFQGDALLDHAADLATLLALGGTAHILPDADRLPGGGAPAIARAYEVFRNWNLDLRRANEWRMLISGRATGETGPHTGAITHPDAPASPLPGGRAIADRLGWVPLLRRYVDMSQRRGVDSRAETALRPGDPTNRELSQGLAYLLGLADA
ncbi:MAG: hypothetical protein H6705_00245 [Myxococcales bacterium]|nr:hypothetical protein [Myxococcales bacterium]